MRRRLALAMILMAAFASACTSTAVIEQVEVAGTADAQDSAAPSPSPTLPPVLIPADQTSPGTPPPTAPPTPAASPAQPQSGGNADCLVGRWVLDPTWFALVMDLPAVVTEITGEPWIQFNADGTGSSGFEEVSMKLTDDDGVITTMFLEADGIFTWSSNGSELASDFNTWNISATGSVSIDGYSVDLGVLAFDQSDVPEVLPPGTFTCTGDNMTIDPAVADVLPLSYRRG